jgi:hypothetical protein
MKRIPTLLTVLILSAWIFSSCKTETSPPKTQTSVAPTLISQNSPSTPETPGSIMPLPDGNVRLSTGDGLSLTLNDAGQIIALSINGESLPVTPSQPVEIRDLTHASDPNVSNLLSNSGFEEGETGWGNLLTKNGIAINVVETHAHSGNHALAISGEEGSGGAIISGAIPVTPGKRYRVSGYFQAELGYVRSSGPPTIWQDSLYKGSQTTTGIYLQWQNSEGQTLEQSPQLAAPLHWNAQDWHQITREVTAPPGAASVRIIVGARPVSGAIWVDDLSFIESPEMNISLSGTLTIYDDRVVQNGEIAGLQVIVTYRPYENHLAITTTVTDSTGGPRALDIGWGIPLSASGWTWWDGLHENRTVTTEEDFARAVSADIAGYLPISLYPYAALENGDINLSLAIPLDSPRYVLLHYDGLNKRYEGLAHLGISPLATRLNNSADFTLLLYQSQAGWGLRAAAEKHAIIGPNWYDTPSNPEEYVDFAQAHFSASGESGEALKEYNEAGIYTAQYTVFELNEAMEDKDSPRPTYTQALEQVQSLSIFSSSVICDSAGEAHLKGISVYRWAPQHWTAIWIPNMDPDISGGYGQVKLEQLKNLFTETKEAGLTVNGVEIDNFISVTTVDLCPEHLALADLPLTYDPNTYQPGVHVASAAWEYLTQLRALLDAQPAPPRGISVNFWGLGIPNLLSSFIDGFASEGEILATGPTNWTTPILDYRRATAMRRLRMYSNQETNQTQAQIETFAHEAIFYATLVNRGTHAANWSEDMENILEWANTQSKPLATLGWEAIPYATTDTPDIWVERYGQQAFTVHNWSNVAQNFTLTIDLTALAQKDKELNITESIRGETVTFTLRNDGTLQINGHLDPGRTAVYWLATP